MTEQITDLRTCCDFLKDTGFKITPKEMNRVSLSSLSPAARSAMYAALSFNRGTLGQAFSFIRVGKQEASDEEERALLLHLEGIFLSIAGDGNGAIQKQHESLDICRLLDDPRLTAEVLSHLSFLYQTKGEKELATKYEKEAARLLLKRGFSRRSTAKKEKPLP
jgi:hypothetical protein